VDIEMLKSKLAAWDVSFSVVREVPGQAGQISAFFSCKTITNFQFVIELKLKSGLKACKVTVRSQSRVLSEHCKNAIVKIIA
jgi:hypothetical protein